MKTSLLTSLGRAGATRSKALVCVASARLQISAAEGLRTSSGIPATGDTLTGPTATGGMADVN